MKEHDLPLRAIGLTKHFGGQAVLDRIDFDLSAGECVAWRGDNGSGKTTLLRCLAGLTRPTSGEVEWFGRRIDGDPAVRRFLGMSAHESRLYPQLTLRENLLFAARMYRVPQPAQRVDALLAEVGLAAHSGRHPSQVSRGMGQRVTLARAVIHHPRVLLLDEPFAGLDEEGARWLWQTLTAMRAGGCAVCLTTHEQPAACQIADRVCELRSARLNEMETDVASRRGDVHVSVFPARKAV
ncbi:MAG: heme ABC exporter ATP-binding protein CcmA [Planctomycetia bacterium]|nr:heme ABC exporter ATP-binding protein CcmA [Planctomycetia bacterium]